MTAKIANKHLDEMEYIGRGFGYHLSHKRYANSYIGTYEWNGYQWWCLENDDGNIVKVLARLR